MTPITISNQYIRPLLVLILLLSGLLLAKAQVGNVLWEDNFDTFNTDIWTPNVGDGCPGLCGWGNAELEYYHGNNVSIEAIPGESGNNALVLEARNESMGSQSFTSGKVDTEGKLSIHYGLIEVRMRVPNLETGLWPAAWLLGTVNQAWPAKGEIDMMEMGHKAEERTRQGYPGVSSNNFVGANAIFQTEDGGYGSIAYDVDYNQPYVPANALSNRFVTYRLYWEPTQMRFAVEDNGTEYDLYTNPLPLDPDGVTAAFTRPFFMLLNLAVGGNFTDAANSGAVTAPIPAKMYIDYVRVSEWNGHGEVAFDYGALSPEAGTFGVYTDDTPTNNELVFGSNAAIYAWGGTVQEGTTPAYEGSNVIAWETTTANSWFGGGVTSLYGKNMSGFVENGSMKFRIKIPANVSFRIGITDNYTNEQYINFPAGVNQYGLVRNGEWGQVEIPLEDFTGLVAFQNLGYLFAITSLDGSLPASTFQFAIDDIYWTDGNGSNVPVTGVSVSPGTASLEPGETQQLTATVTPSGATNPGVSWSTNNATVATVNSSGLVTAQSAGNATITVTTTDGGYTASSDITVTNPAGGLPSPWQSQDIGAVAATGSASYSSGTFTVNGSGSDIWGTTDEFHYVYQSLTGDGVITAQVNSMTNTDVWAKAGVMIRESLAGNSKHALTAIRPTGTSAFQRRTATGGSSSHTGGPTANAPYWVKLERAGDTFTSSVSANGSTWTTMGTATISMGSSVYAGLITTSHNDGTLCAATMSNVSLSTGNPVTYAPLPGIVQSEDYKEGGEGVGYHDTSAGNTGGGYRTDDVDIEATGDTGGGFNIGWVDAGEWLEYDVTSTVASYELSVRVASPSGAGRLHIEVDGINVTGTIAVPNTGSWQSYTTVTVPGIAISPGNHSLRVVFDAAGLNLNYVEAVEETSTPSGCTQSGPNGDYTVDISEDASNPSLTFIPGPAGTGTPTTILYYGTDPNGTYPGYGVSPNNPYTINAANGQTIYFYYTYSVPEGGERNSSANRHSFVVGNCSGSGARVASTPADLVINSGLTVFPNPVKDIVTLKTEAKGYNRIQVLDISGRVRRDLKISGDHDEFQINLNGLSAGNYFIRISGAGETKVRRIIKQ